VGFGQLIGEGGGVAFGVGGQLFGERKMFVTLGAFVRGVALLQQRWRCRQIHFLRFIYFYFSPTHKVNVFEDYLLLFSTRKPSISVHIV